MTTKIAGLLMASTLLLSLSSCKKCEVAEEDAVSGVIIEDAIIYQKIGYLTQTMNGNYVVNGASQYADEFEVSFNGGVTKQAVDYGSYTIIGYPMTVNCKASFTRDVSVIPGSHVMYTIDAVTCTSCENQRYIENWVLVPTSAISGLPVYYDANIQEK